MATGRTGEEMEGLEQIMDRLRAEGGCPWDREQDLGSLRPYLVEEAYEVLEEMDRVVEGGPWRPFCDELGDLLFQIVFHAQLAKERGQFRLADVAAAISEKIVRRHPHVFGDTEVRGADDVLRNWARLKAEERRRKTGSEGSALEGVPASAPALLRAERLTEKASRIGFDWPDVSGVRQKLGEELAELDRALASKDGEALVHELGDVLFTLANLARHLGTPAEDALRAANRRFTERFQAVERGLRERGIPFGQASLAEMDALWEAAKAGEAAVPRPRRLPSAAVAEVRVAVPAAAPEFWARVGPLLGFSVSVEGGAVRLAAGATALTLMPAGGSTPPELEVRLATDVAALVSPLRAAGGAVELVGDGTCVLRDPSGVVVRCRT